MPPWNAQHVFDPAALPQLTDLDSQDVVAPEDTPVRTRIHPDYAPLGVRLGDWIFDPSVSAGSLYDSNVFSVRSGQQSDIAAQLGTELRARTLWERHGINLDFVSRSTLYRQFSSLNETNALFTGTGHYDIDHSAQILGAVKAGYLHEEVGSLTSPNGAVAPTPFGFESAELTFRKEFGRFTTSTGASIDNYTFGSTRTQSSSVISQDARDGQIYTAYGRTDYAFSDKLAVFGAVEGNWRELRGTPTQSLSSDGYRALGGVDLELTRLITGEIAAGYLKQHFFDSSIGNIEGPTYRAMVTWSPSRLVDVHFDAEQMVTVVSDTTSTGVLASALQAGVDYEFRPNITLTTNVIYEKDRFYGQLRQDNVYGVTTKVNYALNNFFSVSMLYRFTRRDSNIDEDSYDKHQVTLNATAHF